MSTPNITLYFLQASRSIRIAWLLEELSLPYESIFFPRENNKAPADFKSRSGNTLGKAPSLTDGSLTMNESGAITEYLIEKYDKDGKLMGGKDEEKRNKIRMWIHAAEDVYESVKETGELKELEKGLAVNVGKDLDWLNLELEGKKFLAGDNVTAADTMVIFSI
ncbi:hypothetical protein BDZ45DRAFT_720504 [Acephala macrosclerotiorum]|nr:hypothetical protein BDZ45DRAFT_720504 [Acephala macrosclerotiorum]